MISLFTDYFTLPDFEISTFFTDTLNAGNNFSNTFNEDSKKMATFTDHNPILIPPTMPRVHQNNQNITTNDVQDQNSLAAIKNSSKNKFSYTNTDTGYDDLDTWNDRMASNSLEAPKILTEQQKVERRYCYLYIDIYNPFIY
jgi:hypothetical protein